MATTIDEITVLPDHARVVIIGAGIVGTSAAYYLTRYGWRDVVVLDQGALFQVPGSTSHAPGLMFQTNSSKTACQLAQWSVELYKQMELDGEPCFYQTGSLEIAYSPERHQELKRKVGHAKSWSLPAEIITPEETKRLIPIMNTERVSSAYYVPSDGLAKGVRLLRALANHARQGGASFYGNTAVTGFETSRGRVRAVRTNRGSIETEAVLLCAGIWGPHLGRMAGVPVPLLPVQHLYVKTAPLAELAGATREIVHPILRHQDHSMYFRQDFDCYGIGSYRHEPLPVSIEELTGPDNEPVRSALRPFTPKHFENAHADAVELFPCFRGADLPYRINGIFAFTPDGNSLVGESIHLRGFWLAEAVWVTHGGGTARAVAEYMVEGVPGIDLRDVDCNRFHSHTFSRPYVRRRGIQNYREVYDITHPSQQMEEPRHLRLSPFHRRQEELGAVFFESAGWERPQWFAANEQFLYDVDLPVRSGWEARHWSPIIGAEHKAARERVALFDLTPFTKIEVAGPDALTFLQSLAANQMDQSTGKITYTAALNDRGRIECDLTVTRLGEDKFLVVTGGLVGMHDLAWLRSHLPQDGAVQITDITSARCCVGLWGPRARDLVRCVSENDFSNEAFPYMTAKEVYVGHVPALALRISYVGELGWEIYAPTEYGQHLWDTLWKAGREFGLLAAGGGAFDSLRLEKGYRLWGVDIHSEYDPYEAGLGFAVRLNKGNFRGRGALERIHGNGMKRRLCCLILDGAQAVVMGKEPILDGDRTLGYVTSANYGYTVGRGIAYGYLPVEYAAEGTKVDVYYFGGRRPATVTREPLYDPENIKLKC